MMNKAVVYRLLTLSGALLTAVHSPAQVDFGKVESVNRPSIKCYCQEDRKGDYYSVAGEELEKHPLSNDAGGMIKFDLAEARFDEETQSVGEDCKQQKNVHCWARRRYFSIKGGSQMSASGGPINPDRLPNCDKFGNTMGSGACKKP